MTAQTLDHTPPPAAVAKDAHWSAKMDRLRNRKPLEQSIILWDEAADAVASEKALELDAQLARAARRHQADVPADLGEAEQQVWLHDRVREVPAVVRAQAAYDAAKAEKDDSDITFTFRGLPADVWESLIDSCPPTAEQAEQGDLYNIRRFGPKLLAACHVDGMTARDAASLMGGEWQDDDREWHVEPATLTQGEASLVFSGATSVNTAARGSLGKG